MANHEYTRALWADNTDLLYTELEHIDAKTVDSLSATGGVYAFSEDLILGGSPGVGVIFTCDFVSFAGDVTVAGEFAVYNDVQISETLHVDGLVAFDGDFVVLGTADIGSDVQIGATLHVDGAVAFDDDLSVLGDLEVGGDQHVSGLSTLRDVTVGGYLDALGAVFLGGVSSDVDVRGTAIFRKRLAFLDGGKIEHRQQILATDANQTCIAAQVDTFYVPNGILTAGTRYVAIDDTGATNGMRVVFRSADTTNIFVVKDHLGNNLKTLIGSTQPWGYAERISNSWVWFTGGA